MRAYAFGCLLVTAAFGCSGGGGAIDAAGAIDAGEQTDVGMETQPTQVTLTLRGRPTDPAARRFIAAYQDGGSSWIALPQPVGDTYTFTITTGLYGVAWTCAGYVSSAHFTVAERTTFTANAECSDQVVPPVTHAVLSGVVANRPSSGRLVVACGSRAELRPNPAFYDPTASVATVNATTGAYLCSFPVGMPTDVFFLHVMNNGADFIIDRALVQRGVVLTAATVLDVDFATSAATRLSPVRIEGISRALVTSSIRSNGQSGLLGSGRIAPYAVALDPIQRQVGDVHEYVVQQVIGTPVTIQTAMAIFAEDSPGPVTLTEPALVRSAGAPGASSKLITTTPSRSIETTWDPYPHAVGYTWYVRRGDFNSWQAWISPGAAGSAPVFRMPDLSTVAGWDARFDLTAASEYDGWLDVQTSSAGGADFPVSSDPHGSVGALPPAGVARAFVRAFWTAQ